MIIDDFPSELFGLPLEDVIPWPNRSGRRVVEFNRTQERVFLALSPWFDVESLDSNLKLFGCKYSLAGANLDGVRLPQDYFGFVPAYYLFGSDGSIRELIQRGTVVYCEKSEENDYLAVDGVPNAASILTGLHSIKWKPKDAVWPTCNGGLMRFLMQFHVPSTVKTKKYFFPDKNIYLFGGGGVYGNEFKVVVQEARYQVAERHYAEEGKKSRNTKKKES